MTNPAKSPLDELQQAMQEAASRGDYERAAGLRDRISLLRGVPEAAVGDFDPSGLVRQRPGAMGLGTSQQRVKPPAGWKPPKKPDPMTSGGGGRRGRKPPE